MVPVRSANDRRRTPGRAAAGRTPYPGTQAVLRAVHLLKAFAPPTPERRLRDLSRELGLHKTTTYRLLSALESEGMVERVPAGEGYRLGPELLVLGARARGSQDLREASRDDMEGLAGSTTETVTLEVLAGSEVLVLGEATGNHRVGANPSVGERWPAHATSTGKVLLAHLPARERAILLGKPLARLTPKTITDPRVLERELGRIPSRGYAVSAEELEPGFVAVGAPVRGSEGEVVAALSVGGPRGRLGPERVVHLARLLTAAAARVSQRLGFRPPPDGLATIPSEGVSDKGMKPKQSKPGSRPSRA